MKFVKNPWTNLAKWNENTWNVLPPKCRFTTDSQSHLAPKGWNSVVGLEIHTQIASHSKLFSGASTTFGSQTNSCVSFFDCAMPGTLPVLNRRCVEAGVLTALALSCKLNEISLFDRKHYFYSDLPAGYQITQQRQPLAIDGEITFQVHAPGGYKNSYTKTSRIKQIQLEQDSGKSIHDESLGRTLIDLNRAGVPLIELVFEPDLTNGEEAVALVKELIIILQRLRTCSCKMEEGVLRVDANISVNRPNESLGIRTEVKNIGSIHSVAAAIKYEIHRQISEIENGGQIVNETRAWDAENNKTISMRNKEEKQDYRFMPEPNLPPLHLYLDEKFENKYDLVDVPKLKAQLPELPRETRSKLEEHFGLPPESILVLINEPLLLQIFHEVMVENSKRIPKTVANILIMDLLMTLNKNKIQIESCCITSRQVGDLIDLLQSKTINLLTTRKILNILLFDPDISPIKIVEENNWFQITDETELIKICQCVIEQNPKIVEAYKSGKKKVLNVLLGEIAKTTNEQADMSAVTKILQRLLNN